MFNDNARRGLAIYDHSEADVIDAIELHVPDVVGWRLVYGDDVFELARGTGPARIEAVLYQQQLRPLLQHFTFELDREVALDDVAIRLDTLWFVQKTRTALARTVIRQSFGDLRLTYENSTVTCERK